LNLLVQELEKRKQYLEKLLAYINRQQENMPQGKHRINNNRGIPRYYHITDTKDTLGDYIPKEKKELASRLAEKDYLKGVKKEVESELRDINNYLKKHNKSGLEDIYRNMNDYRRRNLRKLNEYRRNGIYPGKNLIVTYEEDGSYLNVKEIREMVKEILISNDMFYPTGDYTSSLQSEKGSNIFPKSHEI